MILGIVLLLAWGLSLVRIGGIAEYGGDGLCVRLRLGPVRIRVFPLKPGGKSGKKRKKPGEKKPGKRETAPPEKPGPGGSLELVKDLLPAVAEAAGRLKRKIRIDRIDLDVTAAGADPAAAAMAFGGCNLLVGMIWPLLEHNFTVKDRRIRTAVDFQRTAPAVYLWASLSMTIGQAAVFAGGLLVRFLRVFAAYRAKRSAMPAEDKKQKEAV